MITRSFAVGFHPAYNTTYAYIDGANSWHTDSSFMTLLPANDVPGLWIRPEGYDWIHTVRFQIAVPRIIRLLGYDKLPRQDVKFNRRNIYARDGNRCQYCGKRMSTTELSLDHVTPKSQGGKSSWENIVCCCVKTTQI